jgi:hypothetical protein
VDRETLPLVYLQPLDHVISPCVPIELLTQINFRNTTLENWQDICNNADTRNLHWPLTVRDGFLFSLGVGTNRIAYVDNPLTPQQEDDDLIYVDPNPEEVTIDGWNIFTDRSIRAQYTATPRLISSVTIGLLSGLITTALQSLTGYQLIKAPFGPLSPSYQLLLGIVYTHTLRTTINILAARIRAYALEAGTLRARALSRSSNTDYVIGLFMGDCGWNIQSITAAVGMVLAILATITSLSLGVYLNSEKATNAAGGLLILASVAVYGMTSLLLILSGERYSFLSEAVNSGMGTLRNSPKAVMAAGCAARLSIINAKVTDKWLTMRSTGLVGQTHHIGIWLTSKPKMQMIIDENNQYAGEDNSK